MNKKMEDLMRELTAEIESISDMDEKIMVINEVRESISSVSPFREQPVDCVLWVKGSSVHANDYNPNAVAPPEMRLLHTSVALDGFTMPIVSCDLAKVGEAPEGEKEHYEVVDGFHRKRVGKEYKDISNKVHGYLPISRLVKNREDRMASTIRHNRARGTHGIRPMADIVLDLTRYGWSDAEICKQLGMDLDELLRLKQITGLKDAFMDHEFSKSWEQFEKKYYDTEEEV